MKGCEATGRIMLVIAFIGAVAALVVPYVGPVLRFLKRAGVVLWCAWILWGAYEDPRALVAVRQYRPLKSFTQQAECETSRGGYKTAGGWVDFVCLPETMNPNARR